MSSDSFCIEVARHMAAWCKAHATRDVTQTVEMHGHGAWCRGMPGHFCHGGGAPVAAPQRHVSRGCQDKFVRPAGAVCPVCRVVRAPEAAKPPVPLSKHQLAKPSDASRGATNRAGNNLHE